METHKTTSVSAVNRGSVGINASEDVRKLADEGCSQSDSKVVNQDAWQSEQGAQSGGARHYTRLLTVKIHTGNERLRAV